jgi:Flp pilus assembly protein CpaB
MYTFETLCSRKKTASRRITPNHSANVTRNDRSDVQTKDSRYIARVYAAECNVLQIKHYTSEDSDPSRSIVLSVFPRIPLSVTLQVSQAQSSGVVASIGCLGARSFVCVTLHYMDP